MLYRVMSLVILASLLLAACGASTSQPGAAVTTAEAQGTVPYPPAAAPVVDSSDAYPAPVTVVTEPPNPYPSSGEGAVNTISTATYTNTELKYQLNYPVDWQVNEDGLNQPNREVIFTPPGAAAFTTYFSVSLDERDIEAVRKVYQETLPEAVFSEITIAGQPAIQYTMENRVEVYVPYQDQVYLIYTDQPAEQQVTNMFSSFQFLP